jgi:3-dehydroquinate dehydratase-1
MTSSPKPQIVGVILSPADLQRALRLRKTPDFFEIRLDGLAKSISALKTAIEQLPAPVIVTARHPVEGGLHDLSSSKRRELLLEFLPRAACVDVELRSAAGLAAVLRAARENGVRTIISFHDFRGTPSVARLEKIAREARSLGADIVKVATRPNTRAQLDRLLDFFARHQRGTPKVVAMGIGKLGRASRFEFFRRGCLLNYACLGLPKVAGQLSILELRAAPVDPAS